MRPIDGSRLAGLLLVLPLFLLPSACTLEPGYGYGSPYGGGANIELGVDYYEPYGFDYGGWGGNYRTGPPRGAVRSFGSGNHAYRSAPSSRGMPSIPSGPRGGGGSRGGGGRR